MSPTFATDPTDLQAELYIAGLGWVDVTYPYGLGREDVVIGRGREGEARQVDATSTTLSVRNDDGRFSPRLPTGPWYGLIGRNTPLRISRRIGAPRLTSLDGLGGYCTTPDHSSVSITGDIDLRVDLRLSSWRKQANLIYKWAASSQQSFIFDVTDAGLLRLFWSTTGADFPSVSSTAPVPVTMGRLAVRVTFDVNNGAGGKTATFYTSTTAGVGGAWTQLGDPVVSAGTTSIFDSTAAVTVDTSVNFAEFFAAQIRNGIGGSVAANPDFTVQTDGADSFSDSAGRTWTCVPSGGNDTAKITTRRVRSTVEVASWAQRSAKGGRDRSVAIQGYGVMHRLARSGSVLKSTLYRGLTTLATPPVAYWPCEEETGATQIASALGGPPLSVSGTPGFGSYSGFACSAPIPTFNGSRWVGAVPAYTGTGQIQVRFLLMVPATGGAVSEIINFSTTGTAGSWALAYGTGGALRLLAADQSGTNILDTGNIAFNSDNTTRRVSVELVQDGADIDYRITTLDVGAAVGGTSTGTLTGYTITACTRVQANRLGEQTDLAVGHISVEKATNSLFDLDDELAAYAGETAGRRIERLCAQEGVRFLTVADLDDTEAMGPQPRDTLLGILRQAEATDHGILYEPRELIGLAYRPRTSMHNQTPTLTLPSTSRGLVAADPVEDDDAARNDWVVEQAVGSTFAHAVKETGPLNITDPTIDPTGAGRLDDRAEVNTASDAVLANHAGFLLQHSTVDEARYPVIALDLSELPAPDQAADLDIGSRVVITDPPEDQPPDDITQLVQGTRERLNRLRWTLDLNCSPESPWRVGVYDTDPDSRYSSDGSTLAAGVNSTATSLSVATPTGPLWTHADGDFDIVITGERLTVTNVTGAGSPQTFTVRRSVNGQVKDLPAGAAVDLFRPAVWAL